MARIYGTLTDGTGQIINNCTIELVAKKTTGKVLIQTQAFKVADNGAYTMTVLPCNYEVNLIIDGFPKKKLGTIQVFSDSVDGSLNDYLLNPLDSEITPPILQQVMDARSEAVKAAETNTKSVDEVAKNATKAATSATNAKASESNAAKSVTAAKTSEEAATSAATNAKKSETASGTSETNAKKSESAASNSAVVAKTSETNSVAAASGAAKSASSAETSAKAAANSAGSIDGSLYVKKTGDTMTSQLSIKTDGYHLSLEESTGSKWAHRVYQDNSYSLSYYDRAASTWADKFRYVGASNVWRFDNANDVTINGASILKQGDGGLLGYAPFVNDVFSSDIKTGFYRFDASATNTPIPNSLGYVNKIAWNNNEARVMIHMYNSLRAFTGFKDKNTGNISFAEFITTENIKNYSSIYVGEFRLFPFRTPELPKGWYFRGGDNFLLSSPQGKALNSLSTNYKSDHGITIKTINGQQYINVPTAFWGDGRGFFERASRYPGAKQDDAIRNVTGQFVGFGGTSGSFSLGSRFEWDATGAGFNTSLNMSYVNFNAFNSVPTANENRPISLELTPAIYLGV